jgi:hypothetical protein
VKGLAGEQTAHQHRASCLILPQGGHVEASHALAACILSVPVIVAELLEGIIVEHASDELRASCLILSKGGLVEKHTIHQLRASCLSVALSWVWWKTSS